MVTFSVVSLQRNITKMQLPSHMVHRDRENKLLQCLRFKTEQYKTLKVNTFDLAQGTCMIYRLYRQ